MKARTLVCSMGVVALALLGARAVTAQEAAPAAKESALVDSMQQLKAQVQELSSALIEMRTETLRLRMELQQTRDRLTSLDRRLEESPRAQAPSAPSTVPVAPAAKPVEERVAKLEEEHDLLSQKVLDQYQTKVESASKYRLRVSGVALLNVFGDRGAVDNTDLPSLARPQLPFESSGSLGATVRQSSLGFELFGPSLGAARSSAEVQLDFFGGFPQTLNGVTAGVVRMRTATLRLDWRRTSVVAGQDAPFFSPLSPTSVASLALPAFSYSGNLWTWTPQVRVERRSDISDNSSLLIQGGLLDALSGEPPFSQTNRLPQAGERAALPAIATRVAWTRGTGQRAVTLGAGSYYARQNWGFGRSVDAWAGTADWSLPLAPWLLLTGEFYRGRALGGLGGGIGRSVLFSGAFSDPATSVVGLNAVGGWTQLKFRAGPRLEFNSAFGEDTALARDLRRFAQSQSYVEASLARNQSAMVNGIYHARSNLLFSLEYRRLWTSENYPAKFAADHVNLGIGVLF